jgi:FtsZ-interacting cell division protein YlmF
MEAAMAGIFATIKNKIREITLTPGASDTYPPGGYYEPDYEDDDGYVRDDPDGYYDDPEDEVQVHYTPPPRDRGRSRRDRDTRSQREIDRERDRERAERAERAERSAGYPPSSARDGRLATRTTEPERQSNVFSISPPAAPEQPIIETIIARPKVIDDAVEVGNHVRNGRMCIVDLTNLPALEAQRIADYLGGVCLALDGITTRVNNGIFTVSPKHHKVMSDFREENPYASTAGTGAPPGAGYRRAANE